MKNLLSVVSVTLTIFVLFPEPVYAQRPSGLSRPRVSAYNRPATSPYLDLLPGNRGGRSFTSQYFRQVRPEFEFRRANARFGRSIQDLGQQQRTLNRLSGLSPTGHTTSFLNYRGYFNVGPTNSGGGRF